MTRLQRAILIFLVIVSVQPLLILQGCRKAEKPKRQATAPVRAVQVIEKSVPVQIAAIGNVEAYSTVSVKAQANGILTRVHFKEGDLVRKGDTLFSIDADPYDSALMEARANLEMNSAQVRQAQANIEKEGTSINEAKAALERTRAQVQQAKATLEKDTIESKNAEVEARRQEYLLGKGFTTQEQYDRTMTAADGYKATLKADLSAVRNAEAQVKAAEAALESSHANLRSTKASWELAQAKVKASAAAVQSSSIQLGYCTIASPINGKTGNLAYKEGNLIKSQDTVPLVTINQVTPVYINFSVPERYLNDLKKAMALKTLIVEAFIPNREEEPSKGFVSFIDNRVDTSTGTIQLKGTFPNNRMILWPGQFVNVNVTLKTKKNALLVPTIAIQSGQKGNYVFIVKDDQTAEMRPVKTDFVYHDQTVIDQGVEAGETVVTEGSLKLLTGTRVEIIAAGNSPSKGNASKPEETGEPGRSPEARGK
ncbi:MAG: efflux RND transporter periplasmic adaptor subunit [Vulcanimicrobiota bacterium]